MHTYILTYIYKFARILFLYTAKRHNDVCTKFNRLNLYPVLRLGKTYTLYGALDYMACRLVGKNIRLTFYEVHGKKCYDLLNNRTVVHLRSDENEGLKLMCGC